MNFKILKNGQAQANYVGDFFFTDFDFYLIALRNPLISNTFLPADKSEAFVSNKILHPC